MKKSKRKRTPHIAADLATEPGRRRARREMVWGDHGFLRARFSNLHQLSDEMWRANQPSPRQIAAYQQQLGIKTIINLRGVSTRGYYLLEKEACEKLGITLIDYQVFSRDTPTRETVAGVKTLFTDMSYPALMHCKSGADRAGLMSVLYLLARQDASLAEAAKQLSFKYLHIKQGKTGMLDAFFAAAMKDGVTTAGEFFDWIERDYDRVQVKAAFLKATGRQLELDRLLRRE